MRYEGKTSTNRGKTQKQSERKREREKKAVNQMRDCRNPSHPFVTVRTKEKKVEDRALNKEEWSRFDEESRRGKG